jgi:CMP-N-acetylneuraminic acid synthetase
MDDNNSVNIDTKRDLLLAKILLKNEKKKWKILK